MFTWLWGPSLADRLLAKSNAVTGRIPITFAEHAEVASSIDALDRRFVDWSLHRDPQPGISLLARNNKHRQWGWLTHKGRKM